MPLHQAQIGNRPFTSLTFLTASARAADTRRNSIASTTSRANAWSPASCSACNCRGWLVNHAQRSQGVPAGCQQRGARVEPDVRITRDERIAGKPRVGLCVHHHHQPGLQNRVCAERVLALGLRTRQSNLRLEPLALAVHKRHQGDGCLTNAAVVVGFSQTGQIQPAAAAPQTLEQAVFRPAKSVWQRNFAPPRGSGTRTARLFVCRTDFWIVVCASCF